MGNVKTNKLDNGMIGLEIIYGGKESPFGGVDYSAPPNYIDPKCFADATGFLVVDEQLVPASWQLYPITLGGWTSTMQYLDSGHFFQNKAYYNWSLAYFVDPVAGGPSAPPFTDVTFYIWCWLAGTTGTMPMTAQTTVRQFATTIPATQAVASLMVQGTTAVDTCAYFIGMGPYSIGPISINTGDTVAVAVGKVIAAINVAPYNTFAIASQDPNVSNIIDLKTVGTGTALNGSNLLVTTTFTGTALVPYLVVDAGFAGALDATVPPYGIPPVPTSWVCVGETLYIGGPGTMILQFSMAGGVASFSLLTSYIGAVVLGKFNSQLIAAGVFPGPGTVIQDPEMTLGWSSPNEFGVWNPNRADGTITGAGYNQISDISDYLTGIIINPGEAVILRTQGIDYITPLSGGVTPFDFQHISNALLGEGCQDSKWVTQYDQIGLFIGNGDIYEFSGSIVPVGHKIKNYIYGRTSAPATENSDSASGQYYSSAGTFDTATSGVIACFVIDMFLVFYNFSNKTWMPYVLQSFGANIFDIEWFVMDNISSGKVQDFTFKNAVLVTNDTAGVSPQYWLLTDYAQNTDFPHATQNQVIFPQEEIDFGRDITIEAAYIRVKGDPGVELDFSLNAGAMTASLVLPVTDNSRLYNNYQIFFSTGSTDKITIQNPQLTISTPIAASGVSRRFRISKISLFGSFDPNQRPV